MYDDEYNTKPADSSGLVPSWLTFPFTVTLVGIGALSVALFLAARPVMRSTSVLQEDDGFDVENYDVVFDKPFIYSICE
jgi:hypothetical protein